MPFSQSREQPLARDSRDGRKKNMGAMHIAADKKDVEMLRLLHSHQCSLEAVEKDEQTPIFYGINCGSLEVVKYLHSVGANLEHRETQLRTPFYWAASTGELDIMNFLIAQGVNVNTPSSLGRSALSKACWNGRRDVVEILLTCPNIAIDSQDNNGRTALHNAAWGSAGGRAGIKFAVNPDDSPDCA